MDFYELFGLVWNPAYSDDEPPAAGGDDDPPPAAAGGDDDPPPAAGGGGDDDPPPAKDKVFTQNEVNTILAKEKRKQQDQTKKALDELNALKAKANITAEERQDLDKRIEILQNELLTKEQLGKKNAEKERKRHGTEIEKVTKERDTWKERFTDSTIKRSITDAAAENKAFHPAHIVALLQPTTHLDEVLDNEGGPTGEYAAKVDFDDVGDDGKPVKLSLTVKEAVKKMREMEEHQNLFQGDGAGGLGSQNRGKGGKDKTLADAAKEGPEAYRKARETLDLQ